MSGKVDNFVSENSYQKGMSIMNKIINRMSALAIALSAAASLSAQGYYDDDIYFNPNKDKDRNVEAAKKAASRQTQRTANGYIITRVADYPAADTYAAEGSSTRSVDEYNRRGVFARPDTTATLPDSIKAAADFAYTRQIERYYNPDIIISSDDPEIVELYYAQPAEVNIYVNTPGYGYWGYPYYAGWYDPWYWGTSLWYPYWGPSWSFSWGWGPGWGWGPYWGWSSPIWGPAWGWGWTSPGHGWGAARPYNNPRHPGAMRHSASTGRYSGIGSRSTSGYRPTYRSSSNRYRPSAGTSSSGSKYRPSSTTQSTNQNSNSYTRPGRNGSSSSSSSYRSSGSSSSRHSSGGFSGGGSRSGGGGGSRGGRH